MNVMWQCFHRNLAALVKSSVTRSPMKGDTRGMVPQGSVGGLDAQASQLYLRAVSSMGIGVMAHGFFIAGAILAGLAVALGAFGAHSLKAVLSPEMLIVFDTGVRYQMFHSLALLLTGLAERRDGAAWISRAGWLFLIGIGLFSGSLYALALTDLRWLGAITPFGGLAFLVGWSLLAWGAWKSRQANKPGASKG